MAVPRGGAVVPAVRAPPPGRTVAGGAGRERGGGIVTHGSAGCRGYGQTTRERLAKTLSEGGRG